MEKRVYLSGRGCHQKGKVLSITNELLEKLTGLLTLRTRGQQGSGVGYNWEKRMGGQWPKERPVGP